MSGFTFSHQFSQRWLATPTPIKQTIIQELDDIVTLLHPDTELEHYEFTVANLHDSIEQLLALETIRQQLAAEEAKIHEEKLKQQAEQQAAQPAMPEAQTTIVLPDEGELIIPSSRPAATSALPVSDESPAPQPTAPARHHYYLPTMVFAPDDQTHVRHKVLINNISKRPNAPQPANAPLKTVSTEPNPAASAQPNPDQIKQSIIAPLEALLDQYLQDTMHSIKADLMAWLTQEVDSRLASLPQNNPSTK